MRPARIVEIEVARERRLHLAYRLMGMQVDFFIFNTPPQSFDKYVGVSRRLRL